MQRFVLIMLLLSEPDAVAKAGAATRAITSRRCSVLHMLVKDQRSDPYDRRVAHIEKSVEASSREVAPEVHVVFSKHCEATGAWDGLLGENKAAFE